MNWAILTASIALVIVTVVYTVHTSRMVTEMRATRLLSALPRIRLGMRMVGPGHGEVQVVNVGHGPALDLALTMRVAAFNDERTWNVHLFVAGETAEFFLRHPNQPYAAISLDEAAEARTVVEIEGTAHDIYGREHRITDSFDLARWWEATSNADVAWVEDPRDVANREIEKLRKAVESINKEARALRSVIAPPTRSRRQSHGAARHPAAQSATMSVAKAVRRLLSVRRSR